ncbi:MAG TPA: methyltransferase domain-containing protein [Pyrinomonadaceae bacterium]|nr:methyltransferase domain-containing protein [Pyrinomonadaceae bacterium]
MIEATDSEIDVAQLMTEIREAVARREATGQRSLGGAALEVYEILTSLEESQTAELGELPPLRLQPDFVPSEDDHYHINYLLQYHDHTFIWNAYRALLKREPDEEGYRQFLQGLRSGRINKLDVLASLRFSPEGKGKNVRVEGLTNRPLLRRLYRVPIFGYLLEMLVGVARLPAMIHSQRQFEGHALAQQDLLANHINQLSRTSFEVADSFSRELTELSEEQKKFAELGHQQTVGLWREQREIINRLEKLKAELEARLAVLPETLAQSSAQTPRRETGGTTAGEARGQLDELFASFADEFRGKPEEVKAGLKFYLPFLKEAGISEGVLDVGCGRGEWLELLQEEGIAARGIETNQVLVERARARGLEVIEGDALAHLRTLPRESVSAVTGFHFIEHLPFERLVELLDEIARTLRPAGLLIFETPNPKNLVVGACNFYSDPTHLKPLFPETVRFVLDNRGFEDVRILYVNPPGGSPFKDEDEGSRALDSWFYSPRDFAVIGRRS